MSINCVGIILQKFCEIMAHFNVVFKKRFPGFVKIPEIKIELNSEKFSDPGQSHAEYVIPIQWYFSV